ncbi:23S rRNA pseudouridine1911/1915/1917 synthase [Maribacter vaceletii]|uniref:23S rRNA pseudouridine1911/1915/1917 synthase n=1 Tax=Maribacter vaceletii TaxID=1206816 RepID=A0A495EDR2_9FLAO|nr:RluA family pseudouridine synthase [Maribacter vaceletii]RKR15028.1 23S rRNA pseudouridine1911/1915/1917 synthase [Maribacter vaceletii]
MPSLHILESHTAKILGKPLRLQEYGVGIFKTIATKSALKKSIKKNLVLVNGEIATTATFIYGTEIITLLEDKNTKKHKKIVLSLEVVFEDNYLAIINKPPGILVSGNSFKTIVNALEQNITKSNLPDAVAPKPVHRLDYPTTGLLVIGKTSASIIALNKLFENKEITKTYIAVTIGKMKDSGSITEPIDGKKATSKYQIIKTVISNRFQYLNWVELTPETGRKHQLRKHFLSIGNPILGDPTYFLKNLKLKGKGLYLHAYSLEFMHPFTNKKITFIKNPPFKFNSIFEGNKKSIV